MSANNMGLQMILEKGPSITAMEMSQEQASVKHNISNPFIKQNHSPGSRIPRTYISNTNGLDFEMCY